ncbi:hypothetical protein [Microcoleus sp. CAWBG58]|uniref:hypothetical protein n=1 Tax=Microcoleus sp. CAWBG58 TaxID=2841651 RepID=UPI0025CE11BB|nr:hypothetical protein [Microcoleus sp. CAWBG58]
MGDGGETLTTGTATVASLLIDGLNNCSKKQEALFREQGVTGGFDAHNGESSPQADAGLGEYIGVTARRDGRIPSTSFSTMNQEQALKMAAAMRKLASRVISLEQEVAALRNEEAEEDQWLAAFIADIDSIDGGDSGILVGELV